MERLLFALILCGAICCLSSCDKIGDDESDSGGTGSNKPISPDERAYIYHLQTSDRDIIILG